MIITFFSHPVEIWAPLLTTTCGAVQVHPKVAALTRQRVRKSAFQVLGPAVVVVTMVVGIAIGLSSEPGGRPFNALDVVVATIAVLSCPVSGAAPPPSPPLPLSRILIELTSSQEALRQCSRLPSQILSGRGLCDSGDLRRLAAVHPRAVPGGTGVDSAAHSAAACAECADGELRRGHGLHPVRARDNGAWLQCTALRSRDERC